MKNNFKTVRNFKASENADDMIEIWAKKSIFKEARLPARPFLNCNNTAYCYQLAYERYTAFLLIDILDDMVHLEAFAVKNVNGEKQIKKEIDSLLDVLGQTPL